MSEKKIDYRFKILYALSMWMVICGHSSGGGVNLLFDWFPVETCLPIFIFSSGYFYKKSSEEHPVKYIVKKIKHLVIPFFIYNLIYGLVVMVSRYRGFTMGEDISIYNLIISPIKNGHQFVYNTGGWFVIPLFILETFNVLFRKLVNLVFGVFNKSSNKDNASVANVPEWIFFIIYLALGIGGNQLACMGLCTDWWLVLVRVTFFIPFFALGIFYREKLEKYDAKIPGIAVFLFVFIGKMIIAWVYGGMISYTPSWCNNFIHGPLMPILTYLLGVIFWLRVAKMLEPGVGKNKYVNLIADNTYSIMMNHFLGLMLVKGIFAFLNERLGLFPDFDWALYKSDIGYYYLPNGQWFTLILYSFVGISLPVVMSVLWKKYVVTTWKNIKKG